MRTSNDEEWAQSSMVISEKQRNSKKHEKNTNRGKKKTKSKRNIKNSRKANKQENK